jgi:hypothetical protein
MKYAIGGYFELELKTRELFHKDSLALNSGRNAFEYILLANSYKKVYVPYFTCDVLLQPLIRNNITYEFYNINERLEPVFYFEKLQPMEAFLYTNYFGLKDNYVFQITSRYSNIIIDNAQSFFSKPQNGADTFYSPRKFFGLPDGGYVYCENQLKIDLAEDKASIDRMEHLLKRLAFDAEMGYEDFKRNDESLNGQPILLMSQLTKKLLASIDYDAVKKRRVDNFNLFHEVLKKSNKLSILIDDLNAAAPIVYPYWVNNGRDLRERLQSKRIFTPIYWQNVLSSKVENSTEVDFVNHVVHLPIDQRYNKKEIERIITWING